ncbi:hypothetical protein [Paraburkholderia madseniana]|uniref:hypothetical protein n=1 Tax=Paraburkholderia madseniana TaxID=2599607 RepID=UPI0018EE1661|nr:hypothetical protein [Paraburkholderia madseniana]
MTYQFMFWIPTLLVSYGFSPASAALGSAASAIGGILLTLGFSPQRIVLFNCLPIFLIIALLAISQLYPRRSRAGQVRTD